MVIIKQTRKALDIGTSALYICEGGQSDRVFLLTARHVALPPKLHENEFYHDKHNTQRRHEVAAGTATGLCESIRVTMKTTVTYFRRDGLDIHLHVDYARQT